MQMRLIPYRLKMQDRKLQDLKMQDLKLKDHFTGPDPLLPRKNSPDFHQSQESWVDMEAYDRRYTRIYYKLEINIVCVSKIMMSSDTSCA